jgi:hypothetical protein
MHSAHTVEAVEAHPGIAAEDQIITLAYRKSKMLRNDQQLRTRLRTATMATGKHRMERLRVV